LCGAISLISLAVFITAELTTKEPLIELRLLSNYNFGLANLVMIFFSLGMFGSTFLMPVYLQNSMGYTALQAGSVFLPVGIIQGIIAPVSGRISDRLNPKFPIIIGVLLMAFSFYLNSKLSFLSELKSIMVSLYIRGVGMGLMFTALSTIALVEIPREKMAQASGISNSVRQLGGSLGVAILATLLTSRVNYHAQQYGLVLNSRSEVFQETAKNIKFHIIHDAGTSVSDAPGISQSLIISNLNKQAYIQGINDDFLLASIITLIGGIPVIFMHTKKSKTEKIPIDE
jgi:DHA2 family multidrug resistance protein